MPNCFEDIPDDLPEELIQTLHESDSVRIERIVSRGHASPEGFWYDQPQDEFVVLLSGAATLEFEAGDHRIELKTGDYLVIPARTRHRVVCTSQDMDSVWLAIHH
ncbi:MAG: cupin domain-containing protein [Planctomycetota bacterium]